MGPVPTVGHRRHVDVVESTSLAWLLCNWERSQRWVCHWLDPIPRVGHRRHGRGRAIGGVEGVQQRPRECLSE